MYPRFNAAPTSTTLPPTTTSTSTPSPTSTIEPTATPEGFQTTDNGNVQIFEDGQWVDLKAPEGFGGVIDGVKVVIENDGQDNEIAVAQMVLEGGFTDKDDDNILNVATYDKAAKKWELVPDITVARSMVDWKTFSANNFRLDAVQGGFYVNMAVAGFKFETSGDTTSVKLLALYKNKIVRLPLNEFHINEMVQNGVGGLDIGDRKILEPEKLNIADVLGMIDVLNNMTPANHLDSRTAVVLETIPSNRTLEECIYRGVLPPMASHEKWCRDEFKKESERKITSKANVEQFLLFNSQNVQVDDSGNFQNPALMWDLFPELQVIDGAWSRFDINFPSK